MRGQERACKPAAFALQAALKVNGHFDLPEGSPGRARSNAISFCLADGLLRSMSLSSTAISFCPTGRPSRGGSRPAPAPRLSGKHNRPPQAGTFVGSHFFTDRSRFAPAQRSLVPPSMAGHPEMFISSAVVMPPQGQHRGQNPSQKPSQKPNI